MSKCIFCDNDCDNAEWEHIIWNALGGSLKTNEIVCTSCNKDFSDTIDETITAKYNIVINFLGPILKSTIKSPSIKMKAEDGKVTRLAGGLEPHLDKAIIIENDDGTKTIIGDNKKHINKIAKSMGAKIKDKQIEHDILEPDKKLHINVRKTPLIHPNEFRAIGKCLFEYYAYKKRNISINDEWVNCIKGRELPFKKRVGWIRYEDIVEVNKIFDKYNRNVPFSHRIIIDLNGYTKKITGYLILFEHIGYKAILEDSYMGKNETILYQRNLIKNAPNDYNRVINKSIYGRVDIPFYNPKEINHIREYWDSQRKRVLTKAKTYLLLESKDSVLRNYEKVLTKNSSIALNSYNSEILLNIVWNFMKLNFNTKSDGWISEHQKIYEDIKNYFGNKEIKGKGNILDKIWRIHLRCLKHLLKYVGKLDISLFCVDINIGKSE